MIRLFASCFLLLAAMAPADAAPAWTIRPEASTLEVAFKQGGQEFTGRFQRFAGRIEFSPDDLAASRVEIDIDTASFTAGDGSRDSQAKGPAWLDVTGAPSAVYRTTGFKDRGDGLYAVEAQLTIRGITKTIGHEALIRIEGDRATATGRVPIARKDFAIGATADPSGQAVGLEVEVRFQIQATQG